MSLIFQEKFDKTKLLKNLIGISSRDPTPCLWNLNENFDNIAVYLKSIIKEQIIFDGFSNKSIEFLDLRAKIVNQIIQIPQRLYVILEYVVLQCVFTCCVVCIMNN